MSNFLNNLAMRSFSPATGLRPRLAALFEPPGAVPGEAVWPGTVAVQDAEVEPTGSEAEPGSSSKPDHQKQGFSVPSVPLAEHFVPGHALGELEVETTASRMRRDVHPEHVFPGQTSLPGATAVQQLEVETTSSRVERDLNFPRSLQRPRRGELLVAERAASSPSEENSLSHEMANQVTSELELRVPLPGQLQRLLIPFHQGNDVRTAEKATANKSAVTQATSAKSWQKLTSLIAGENVFHLDGVANAVHSSDEVLMNQERSMDVAPRSQISQYASPRPEARLSGGASLLPPQGVVTFKLDGKDRAAVPPLVRSRKRPMQDFDDRPANVEPSIQVTIGRVEVRAEVTSHADSRRERTPSPVMSLDEYLRRRAKRGGE